MWFWGKSAFVIEAKSDNENSLHKKDSGQMHDCSQGARGSYAQYADRLQPAIVTRVTRVDANANFSEGEQVLTQARSMAIGSCYMMA